MKKILIMILLVVFSAAVLTACGSENHEPTVVVETPAPVMETAKTEVTPETQTEPAAPEETEQPEEISAFDNEKYQIALGLIDKTVEELYEAIGYPVFQDYGPSCMGGPGSEDGQLDYEGFSVFTLVEDGVETIIDVLRDGEF